GLTAFVNVDLTQSSHRASFVARMKALPEVLECHHVTGDYDYLLKIACRNPLHIDQFLNESIKQGDEVARTRTVIVLGSPKEILFVPPE
ncbi:MAG: Lrp/AsnC ligand binding domain-containing protein, partial [Gemmatimonadaceae bacterium]